MTAYRWRKGKTVLPGGVWAKGGTCNIGNALLERTKSVSPVLGTNTFRASFPMRRPAHENSKSLFAAMLNLISNSIHTHTQKLLLTPHHPSLPMPIKSSHKLPSSPLRYPCPMTLTSQPSPFHFRKNLRLSSVRTTLAHSAHRPNASSTHCRKLTSSTIVAVIISLPGKLPHVTACTASGFSLLVKSPAALPA